MEALEVDADDVVAPDAVRPRADAMPSPADAAPLVPTKVLVLGDHDPVSAAPDAGASTSQARVTSDDISYMIKVGHREGSIAADQAALDRRNWVIGQMADNNYITDEQAAAANPRTGRFDHGQRQHYRDRRVGGAAACAEHLHAGIGRALIDIVETRKRALHHSRIERLVRHGRRHRSRLRRGHRRRSRRHLLLRRSGAAEF